MKFNFITCNFIGDQQIYKTGAKLVGGAEIYLYDLAQYLISQGHRVTVIQSGTAIGEVDYNGILVRTFRLPGLSRKFRFLPENYYEYNFFWKKYLDKDVDRVHLHYLQHAWPNADSDMTATCHGIDWDIPKKEYIKYGKLLYSAPYRWGLAPFYSFNRFMNRQLFTRFALQRLQKIASVDSFLLRYVQSEYPDLRHKIQVIPNYVDTDVFFPSALPSSLLEKYATRRIILFPRNLSLNRGAHYAIEAMRIVAKHFPRALLLMTGTGIALNYIESQIRLHNLGDNIHLLGHVDHWKDLPSLYNLAEIVIIPTAYSEGTSLSCLEAMATGKPVITTNVGGLYDLITSNENGLVAQPNAESLAANIIQLLEDPSFGKTLGSTAQDHVIKKYTKQLWQARYHKFFNL